MTNGRLSRRSLGIAIAGGLMGVASHAQRAQPQWNADRLRLLQAQLPKSPHVRAFLMERAGAAPFEHYRPDTTIGTRLGVASVTKSVVSLLVGVAIERGAVASIDEPLAAFFPEHAQGTHARSLKRVRLRHLLTMCSGFDHQSLNANTDYPDFANRLFSPGLLAHALGRAVVDEPGSRFYYSNIDSHLVAVALSRRLAMPLAEFASVELFGPMGIEGAEWAVGQDGVPDGAAGLRMAPAQLLRLGRMVLNGGRWLDRQLVPQAFVREATSRQVASDVPPRGRAELWGYGYLWWTSSTPGDDLPAFYAAGYGGQFIYVVPALDLVVVAITEQVSREAAGRTAALIRDFALPAVAR